MSQRGFAKRVGEAQARSGVGELLHAFADGGFALGGSALPPIRAGAIRHRGRRDGGRSKSLPRDDGEENDDRENEGNA